MQNYNKKGYIQQKMTKHQRFQRNASTNAKMLRNISKNEETQKNFQNHPKGVSQKETMAYVGLDGLS